MEISHVTKVLPPETLPVWAQVALGVGALVFLVMLLVVAWMQGASDGERARYGHGKRGQGHD